MQLFVLGMHRSGTSAVTRILNLAGAYFGPEGISNGADEGNPKGFWERTDVRALCDGLLQDSGFDWWKLSGFSVDRIPEDVRSRHLTAFRKVLLDLDAHRPWVLKEPRLSVLFPVIQPLLEVPVCIHVVREPLEVAGSLRTRNGFPLPVGLALWEIYTLRALQASAGLPRMLVRYDELIGDPIPAVQRLITEVNDLGVRSLQVPADLEIEAFLTSDLHRERRAREDRARVMNLQQVELADLLDRNRILDLDELPEVSEGGLEALGGFEADRTRLDAAERRVASLEDEAKRSAGQARAEADKVAELVRAGEEQLASTAKLREDLIAKSRAIDDDKKLARDALYRAERQALGIAGSRTWKTTEQAKAVRRKLTPGARAFGRDPLEVLLAEVREARRVLYPPGHPGRREASDGPKRS